MPTGAYEMECCDCAARWHQDGQRDGHGELSFDEEPRCPRCLSANCAWTGDAEEVG